jgi:hypothetical protein
MSGSRIDSQFGKVKSTAQGNTPSSSPPSNPTQQQSNDNGIVPSASGMLEAKWSAAGVTRGTDSGVTPFFKPEFDQISKFIGNEVNTLKSMLRLGDHSPSQNLTKSTSTPAGQNGPGNQNLKNGVPESSPSNKANTQNRKTPNIVGAAGNNGANTDNSAATSNDKTNGNSQAQKNIKNGDDITLGTRFNRVVHKTVEEEKKWTQKLNENNAKLDKLKGGKTTEQISEEVEANSNADSALHKAETKETESYMKSNPNIMGLHKKWRDLVDQKDLVRKAMQWAYNHKDPEALEKAKSDDKKINDQINAIDMQLAQAKKSYVPSGEEVKDLQKKYDDAQKMRDLLAQIKELEEEGEKIKNMLNNSPLYNFLKLLGPEEIARLTSGKQ